MADKVITLTESEAAALDVFLDVYLKDEAMNVLSDDNPDPDGDGMFYLENLFSVRKKCKEVSGYG